MRNLYRLATAATVAAASVVGFATGASAAVTGTATPNSGLTDQQNIRVQASGLPANTVIHVVECTHGASTSADCEGFTDDPTVSSDASGNYDNTAYTVYKLPDAADPTASITCDSTHACDLYVGDDLNNLATSNHTMIPISFAAAATTTTTVAPTTTTAAPTTTTIAATTTTQATTVPAGAAGGLLPLALVGFAGLGGAAAMGRRRLAKSESD